MSVFAPTTVIKGVVYVMWVKDTKPYGDPDSIYAVVHKGNSRFGHQAFKYVSENANKKFMFCTKVTEGKEDPTWQQCLDEMKVLKAPKGSPVKHIDRAYSFVEVATMAYSSKYFTSEEGLAHLAEKTGPAASSVPVSEPSLDQSSIIAGAKAMSETIDHYRASGSGLTPHQQPSLIPAPASVVDNDPVKENAKNDVVCSGNGLANSSVDDIVLLDEDTENLKERVVMAESANDALRQEKEVLESKLTELGVQLKSSMEHQKNFMAVGDVSTMTLEKMNDDTADKVVKKLDAKLAVLPGVHGNVGTVLVKVAELNTAVTDLPNLLEGMSSRFDTSHDSLSEGVSTTNDILNNFGMAEDENALNIPACIRILMERSEALMGAQLAAPSPAPATSLAPASVGRGVGDCYFLQHKVVATFVCKCGCGYEIQAEHTQLDSGTPALPLDIPGTVAHQAPQQQVSLHGTATSPFVAPSQQPPFSSPAPPVGSTPQYTAPGYSTPQFNTAQFATPQFNTPQYTLPPGDATPLPSYQPVSQSQYSLPPTYSTQPLSAQPDQAPKLSRKQKKLVREQNFAASKKLKFGPGDVTGQRMPSRPSLVWQGAGSSGLRMVSHGGQPSLATSGAVRHVAPGFVRPRQLAPNTLPNRGSGILPPPPVWLNPNQFQKPN